MLEVSEAVVCVCVFIKLHITAQSGLVILVTLCHSHSSPPNVCVCVLDINRSGLNHTKQYRLYSIGYSMVANPVGGLLGRKRSEEYLQSYNECTKTYSKQDKKRK